jgi:Holliday junction DNA helicase RuvA
MIGMLNGRMVEKNPTELLVDCGGVCYEVKISLNTFSVLGDEESVRIYTKLIVREDAHIL